MTVTESPLLPHMCQVPFMFTKVSVLSHELKINTQIIKKLQVLNVSHIL